MVNMAQPGSIVANRVGITSFWNYSWFKDLNYKFNFHQDFIIKKFVNFFILFGIIYKTHPWISKVCFKKDFLFKLNKKSLDIVKFKYYRLLFLKKAFFKVKEQYLRKSLPIVYPSKIWILRLFNWIIIAWFFFKPKVEKFLKFKNFFKKKKIHLKPVKTINFIFFKRKNFLLKLRFTELKFF